MYSFKKKINWAWNYAASSFAMSVFDLLYEFWIIVWENLFSLMPHSIFAINVDMLKLYFLKTNKMFQPAKLSVLSLQRFLQAVYFKGMQLIFSYEG